MSEETKPTPLRVAWADKEKRVIVVLLSGKEHELTFGPAYALHNQLFDAIVDLQTSVSARTPDSSTAEHKPVWSWTSPDPHKDPP